MIAVVDTNVAVVANGHSRQASADCVDKCATALDQLKESGALVLDGNWLILREYLDNLQADEQSAGNAFLKWALTHLRNPHKCTLIPITQRGNDPNDFHEFPSDPALATFDPADRKFVAVARAHPKRPPVWQAVDAKWYALREPLKRNGVGVLFLCEADVQRLRVTSKQ
jgi:hypothetical protein